MQVPSDGVVKPLICVANVTLNLRLLNTICRKGKGDWTFVRILGLKRLPVNRSAIQPGWCSRFEPANRKA
jgi:hypothetical protein